MARIFITGSTDGLGRAAARMLIEEGHHVVLHARSRDRSSAVHDLAARCAGVVIGDLPSHPMLQALQENTFGTGTVVIRLQRERARNC